MSDEEIAALIAEPKSYSGKAQTWRQKLGHAEMDFELNGGSGSEFILLLRKRLDDEGDFSVGIRWKRNGEEDVILLRMNGDHGGHRNPIEGTAFDGGAHVHRATARYIDAGKRAEHFAEPTAEYATWPEALEHMLRTAHVTGVVVSVGLFS